ncbi:putative zinc-binding metallopeptidase, partial [Acinetobacter variabilis]
TYATAHPWEDWAETWAHYLHIMDTLETAFYGGLRVDGNGKTLASMSFNECPIGGKDIEHILDNWITLTFNLNALNRSMGLEDAYPFTLTEVVKNKLRFIHSHVLDKAFKEA